MALIKRRELPAFIKGFKKSGEAHKEQIFLFFGERFLCREAADMLQQTLLHVESAQGTVNSIDGDSEDVAKTLGRLLNFSILPGAQIFRVTDSRLFHSENVTAAGTSARKDGTTDLAMRYMEAFKKGIPPATLLILSAESVDKRKQFFKFIKKEGLVVDCSIDSGTGAAAQKGQKAVLQELVRNALSGLQKKIQTRALDALIERVGFHPVAVVMEVEKLALYAGDRETISVQDLEDMVGRTREDALFELTDAFGKRQGARTLVLLHRLQDNGMHALQILATMRNYLRKLLVFRSIQLQPDPVYSAKMKFDQFQKEYLPDLKKREEWTDMLKGHPYAVFMSFSKAQDVSCTVLKNWLELLLQAEFRLKGSPLAADLVLDELFLTMLAAKRRES